MDVYINWILETLPWISSNSWHDSHNNSTWRSKSAIIIRTMAHNDVLALVLEYSLDTCLFCQLKNLNISDWCFSMHSVDAELDGWPDLQTCTDRQTASYTSILSESFDWCHPLRKAFHWVSMINMFGHYSVKHWRENLMTHRINN